jgi:dihydrofolate reductase
MRKIILNLAVSLDGYIEGPNGEVDWCMMDDDMNFGDFLSDIDAIFYGRVSYDLWGKYQPDKNAAPEEIKLWHEINSKKKYVFSKISGQHTGVEYINDDIIPQVREIKIQTGQNIWLYGGSKIITTFMNLRLIDIYSISVHPVILGAGKPLFSEIKDRLNLILKESKTFRSGVVQLNYVPAK